MSKAELATALREWEALSARANEAGGAYSDAQATERVTASAVAEETERMLAVLHAKEKALLEERNKRHAETHRAHADYRRAVSESNAALGRLTSLILASMTEGRNE